MSEPEALSDHSFHQLPHFSFAIYVPSTKRSAEQHLSSIFIFRLMYGVVACVSKALQLMIPALWVWFHRFMAPVKKRNLLESQVSLQQLRKWLDQGQQEVSAPHRWITSYSKTDIASLLPLSPQLVYFFFFFL